LRLIPCAHVCSAPHQWFKNEDARKAKEVETQRKFNKVADEALRRSEKENFRSAEERRSEFEAKARSAGQKNKGKQSSSKQPSLSKDSEPVHAAPRSELSGTEKAAQAHTTVDVNTHLVACTAVLLVVFAVYSAGMDRSSTARTIHLAHSTRTIHITGFGQFTCAIVCIILVSAWAFRVNVAGAAARRASESKPKPLVNGAGYGRGDGSNNKTTVPPVVNPSADAAKEAAVNAAADHMAATLVKEVAAAEEAAAKAAKVVAEKATEEAAKRAAKKGSAKPAVVGGTRDPVVAPADARAREDEEAATQRRRLKLDLLEEKQLQEAMVASLAQSQAEAQAEAREAAEVQQALAAAAQAQEAAEVHEALAAAARFRRREAEQARQQRKAEDEAVAAAAAVMAAEVAAEKARLLVAAEKARLLGAAKKARSLSAAVKRSEAPPRQQPLFGAVKERRLSPGSPRPSQPSQPSQPSSSTTFACADSIYFRKYGDAGNSGSCDGEASALAALAWVGCEALLPRLVDEEVDDWATLAQMAASDFVEVGLTLEQAAKVVAYVAGAEQRRRDEARGAGRAAPETPAT
jgi:hypothetical protein